MDVVSPYSAHDTRSVTVSACPVVPESVPVAKRLSVCKEKKTLASGERPASSYQVPHPLPRRRDRENPEVRGAEVCLVKSLPPSLAVAEEFSEEGGLCQAFPHDRHRTAIRFEEEVRSPTVLWRAVEL